MDFDKFFNEEILLDGSNISNLDDGDMFKKAEDGIKNILHQKFTGKKTHYVKIPSSDVKRINMACPYCGDSKSDENKKRGNLYVTNYMYKCYNCLKFTSFVSMLDTFGEVGKFSELELAYYKSKQNETSSYSGIMSGNSSYMSELSVEVSGISTHAISRTDLIKKMGFTDIRNNIPMYNYLDKRKQLYTKYSIDDIMYSRYYDALVFLNRTKDGEGVFGLQLRFNNPTNGQRFKSMNYEWLITKIMKSEEVDDDTVQRMNKISLLYNISRVDFSRPVTVFESTFDSRHFDNSMAIWSASTPFYYDNALYFFDNTLIDDAGRIATTKMISKGYKVFLWGKFINDNPKYKHCKDLNDMFRHESFDLTQEYITKYFGKDLLDMIYINKSLF